jgi:hypothetical protein
MDQFTLWAQIAVLVVVFVIGNLSQKRHIDALKDTLNKRFDEMLEPRSGATSPFSDS